MKSAFTLFFILVVSVSCASSPHEKDIPYEVAERHFINGYEFGIKHGCKFVMESFNATEESTQEWCNSIQVNKEKLKKHLKVIDAVE